MTKRLFLSFWLLLMPGMATAQNTYDEGVIINGVKWATRNVDKPGTFASGPESPGMFYQWNRKTGWSAANPMVNFKGGTKWDNTVSKGNTWAKSNDPSPAGWRVPTLDEIKKLFDTDKVDNEWTTVNSITGRKFTDKATGVSIFLPAAGNRRNFDGTLKNAGSYGNYWSSMQSNNASAYRLGFNSDDENWNDNFRSDGLSIRSVAE